MGGQPSRSPEGWEKVSRVTFTILRTITPAAASTRGLFALRSQRSANHAAGALARDASLDRAGVFKVRIHQSTRKVTTPRRAPRTHHGVLPVPGLRRTRAQVVLRLMAGRRLPENEPYALARVGRQNPRPEHGGHPCRIVLRWMAGRRLPGERAVRARARRAAPARAGR